jgi:hypothetical protein
VYLAVAHGARLLSLAGTHLRQLRGHAEQALLDEGNAAGRLPCAADQVPVRFVDRVAGWTLSVAGNGKPQSSYRVEVRRSPSIAAYAAVLVMVMIALAGVGAFVAIQTARDRRKFQPPMTTWYAAMLFAVIPLRNALPGLPKPPSMRRLTPWRMHRWRRDYGAWRSRFGISSVARR